MPLKGRVGRHTKDGGRHCQNWADDQQVVIALLNKIPVADGGVGGALTGNIGGRLVPGMASDALYRAISTFEDKHFPGQRSGFVDPGGKMLQRMEALAARPGGKPTAGPTTQPPASTQAPDPAAEGPLDILRRCVLDESWSKKNISVGDRIDFEPLVTMAVRHIDSLKQLGLTKLPWRAEMFGRAYVTTNKFALLSEDDPATVEFFDTTTRTSTTPPLPEMSYGDSVDPAGTITTGKLGALLLYDDGACMRVYPYRDGGNIDKLGQLARKGWARTRRLTTLKERNQFDPALDGKP